MNRRAFLKLFGGILASSPALMKMLMTAEKTGAVQEGIKMLKKTTTEMPEWLPGFIEKIKMIGKAKEIDEKVFEYVDDSLPGVKVTEDLGDQKYLIEGQNEYGQKFQMEYEAPKTLEGGEKFPGDFVAEDTRPVASYGEDVDYDVEVLDSVDEILGGDGPRLEKYVTGKDRFTKGERQVGWAESRVEEAMENIDIDEGYKDGGLTRTIPPKRGPMSEGVESLFRTR